MAQWFRSEDMAYVSIYVSEDAAHKCVNSLGKLGAIQFTDLNPDLTPFQRRYVNFIKRIDELERKIKFFGDEIHKFNMHAAYQGEVEAFIMQGPPTGAGADEVMKATAGATGLQLLEMLEKDMESEESQLVELNKFSERLTSEYNEKVEFQEVLLKTRGMFVTQGPQLEAEAGAIEFNTDPDDTRGAESALSGSELKFSYMAGVINESDRNRFELQLFRTARGNCYPRFIPIEQPLVDPSTGESVVKLVFIIFFKSTVIETKVKKICDAFNAKRFAVPDMYNDNAVRQLVNENYTDLQDARVVLLKNRDARIEACHSLAGHIEVWSWTVLREKATYHALNAFRPDVRGMLRGEGWVIKDQLDLAKTTVSQSGGQGVPAFMDLMPQPWPTPPTHFTLNGFTVAFQDFVDTYGVPRYKEANPALFAAATFPFLYGVMYGDIGHGFILFMGGCYLVWSHNSRPKGRRAVEDGELMRGMYLGRWMIVMMGFFSVYAGLVYNDWFAIGLDLFGTTWSWPDGKATEKGTPAVFKSYYGDARSNYPFGMDPAWHVAENELLFYNSMKMKMSVILGILQMTMGIFLKAANAKYFNQPLDFYLEFVPMILFDCALFGYMVILIFTKWAIDWDERMYSATCLIPEGSPVGTLAGFTPAGLACVLGTSTTKEMCPLDYGGTGDGCQPPNLITTLINIALAPGSVDDPMFAGQAGLQTFLLLIAFFCVPVLLCGKPFMLKRALKSEARRDHLLGSDASMVEHDHEEGAGGGHHDVHPAAGGHGGGGGGHGENFSEILIHQAIETIEFVLGMVSNTASYLRLWALSLAHTELATVFWEKAMLSTINMNSPIAVFCGFAVFMSVTTGVLLCMDVLECFLHALRLHWVEFQNKFYKADGYKFQPFSLVKILEASPVY